MTRKTYRSENAKKMSERPKKSKPERTSAKQTRKAHHDGLGQSGQSKRR